MSTSSLPSSHAKPSQDNWADCMCTSSKFRELATRFAGYCWSMIMQSMVPNFPSFRWFETSALNGNGVETMFRYCGNVLLNKKNYHLINIYICWNRNFLEKSRRHWKSNDLNKNILYLFVGFKYDINSTVMCPMYMFLLLLSLAVLV